MDVQELYKRVNEDLARKGKGGYSSNDEFNRSLRYAQNELMSAHIKRFDASQSVTDALIPFIKEAYLAPSSANIVSYPSDYRHEMELGRATLEDNCGAEFEYWPSNELKANNKLRTITSQVRMANAIKKVFLHEYLAEGIRVYPKGYTGTVYLKYISQPPTATRAVTQVSDEEQYDSASSVQPIWPDQEENRLAEILLYYKGVSIRDPLLLEFFNFKPIIQ